MLPAASWAPQLPSLANEMPLKNTSQSTTLQHRTQAYEALTLPCTRRYIWLPLWVMEIPQGQGSPLQAALHTQQRAGRRQRVRSMRPGARNMQELPPIDVVVRCGPSLINQDLVRVETLVICMIPQMHARRCSMQKMPPMDVVV